MNSAIKRAVAVVLMLVVMPLYAFGDFFSTTVQRQTIDVMRERGGIDLMQQVQEPDEIKMNGFYYKSRDKKNKGTVWVNGKPLAQDTPQNGVTVERLSEKDTTAHVSIEHGGRALPFKPGQKLYLDDRKIVDAYQ